MKTNKFFPQTITENVIYENVSVTITKENNCKLFFQIKQHPYTETYNVAEAVAILMRCEKLNHSELWDIELCQRDKELDSTAGAMLYLSGGLETWETIQLDWLDHYSHLDSEYGFQIRKITKNSATLQDIKQQFIDDINLDRVYNSILRIVGI